MSVVDAAPKLPEDIATPNPAFVEFDSVAGDVTVDKDEIIVDGVVVDAALTSLIDEDATLLLAIVGDDVITGVTFEAAVEEGTKDDDGVITDDEDEDVEAEGVAVVVLVEEASGVLVVVTGGDGFVFVGATT